MKPVDTTKYSDGYAAGHKKVEADLLRMEAVQSVHRQKEAAFWRAKKSEAHFTNAGNLAKAQGARVLRAALVAHL